MKTPLFELGQLVATRGAADLMLEREIAPGSLLARHVTGDWGDMDASDKHANETALKQGFRIFSAYVIGEDKFWVITEADRSVTTILLPEEY